jgi:hypothetical protein
VAEKFHDGFTSLEQLRRSAARPFVPRLHHLEFTVKTEGASVNIRVRELEADSWVMFKLPGFTKAAAGAEQNSLDALRGTADTLQVSR